MTVLGEESYDREMNLLIRWIVNTIALFIVVHIVPGFSYGTIISLAVAAAVLGLLNAVVKPLLFVLTFPLTLITLGLFLVVLNAIMLELTAWLVPGFAIHGFGWAIVGAIALGLISLVTSRIGRERE